MLDVTYCAGFVILINRGMVIKKIVNCIVDYLSNFNHRKDAEVNWYAQLMLYVLANESNCTTSIEFYGVSFCLSTSIAYSANLSRGFFSCPDNLYRFSLQKLPF